MKAWRWALALLLLTSVGWWAAPERAFACSCAYELEHPALIERAEVIFSGTVTKNRVRGQTRTLTFIVDRVYKGSAYATQTVTTAAQVPACGLELTRSGPYVVFAQRTGSPGDMLEANSCGGTRAAPIAADLGPGQTPTVGRSRTGGLPWLAPAGVGVGLLGAGIGLAIVIRHRRSAGPEG